LSVMHVEQPVVGDGYSMRVEAQVQNPLGTTKRRFGVDRSFHFVERC
jgi:hypothetical protein